MKGLLLLFLLPLGCDRDRDLPAEPDDMHFSQGTDGVASDGLMRDAHVVLDGSGNDHGVDALVDAGVSHLLSWTEIAAGPLSNTICGLSSGHLECMTSQGQLLLGGGSYEVDGEIVSLPDGSDFLHVSGQAGRGCALNADWQIECWGGLDGQAEGIFPDEALFVDVAVGDGIVCGLTDVGYLRCWGSMVIGEHDLGLQNSFSDIIAENWLACGLTASSFGICLDTGAGERFGRIELGGPYRKIDLYRGDIWHIEETGVAIGTTLEHGVLDPIFGNEPLREIAAGELAVCALGDDSSVRCQQLTEGDYQPPPEGVRFSALVAAGPSHCGLDLTGQVWCWGQFPQNPYTAASP